MTTNTETDKLLEINHLYVDYLASSGTVHAVTDVSFTLHSAEIIGLAGESGCGKSTLAYAISRLLRPPAVIPEGEVLYYPSPGEHNEGLENLLKHGVPTKNGAIDVLHLSEKQLRAFRWNDVAIVFQSAMNALNPVLTIGTQIMDVLKTHRPHMSSNDRKQRAAELLRLVGIAPDRLNSFPHELSGGMRQRTIIAIALALSAEIIIMDEPTTALDVVVQREILTEIVRLRDSLHFSVIFITHDLSLLLELADKVVIMYAGRAVEKAESTDLYLHPRHPYSYGLLHSFPMLHGPRRQMTGIPGSPPDLRNVPSGCPFHTRCPMVFDVCPNVIPPLGPAVPENMTQLVACHLYNKEYYPSGPPSTADLAAGYEALTEGSAKL